MQHHTNEHHTNEHHTNEHHTNEHYTNEHHTNEHHSHKRKIANSYRIFLVFPLALFYYEVFLRIFGGTNVFKHFFSLLFLTAGAAVFLTGITSFIPKKPRRISVIVLLILLGLLFAAESVIRSVFKTYMTPANLLSGAGNVAGKYGGELSRSIIFGIPKIVIFQVPAALYWKLSASRMRKKPYPVTFSAFFAVLGLLVYLITCLFISHGKFSALYGAQFTYNRATENFGLVTSTRLSIRYSLFGNKNTSFHEGTHNMVVTPAPSAADNESDGGADGEENARPAQSGQNVMDISFPTDSGNEAVDSLSAYLETLIPTDKNAYTGLFEGKNLIMIAAESYCSAFITPELTPVLYRLTHNGFYFSDFYQPEWGGSTTTGETGIMTGLAPQWGDDSMILTSGNNNYFTMGNQLQRLGYSSCAFHNGSYDYYSRQNTHENLGYDQWVANETGMGELTGAHYSSDTMMMSATIDLYIDKQPFNIYYMTLSGHAPYKESSPFVSLYYDQVNAILGDQYEETTKYYICYQMELENAMAILVNRLEEAGIADDTVIMLIGDHYPYGLGSREAWGNDKDYIDDLLKADHHDVWNRDRNSLILWSGCLENEYKDMAVEISSPTYSLDILPTLSNLFGLEFDSRLMAGRDVFSNAVPLVLWNSMEWKTEKGIYDSREGVFIPNEGETVDEDYVDMMNRVVQNKLLMSRTIIENNYYWLLFGDDDVTSAGQVIYEGGSELDGENG